MRRRRGGPAWPPFTAAAGTWAAAGNRFTKLRVTPPLPIGAYRSKISSVPLTGGQASGTIIGIPAATGSATSPAPFTVLCESIITVGGLYTVGWSVALAGTLSGLDANNFGLFLNSASQLAASVNAAAAGTYRQVPVTVLLNAGDRIEVGSDAGASTAGAVYTGTIPAQAQPLTLSVGPQGLGAAWYPAQVTLSTTTGALDTSTANIYLGVGGVPTTLVGSVFSGNGVAALAVPPMQAGDLVFVTWVNGHTGDVAALNIIGTMDALTTGRG